MKLLRKPNLPQGLYYLITGLWPLIHVASFVHVSGPKEDLWLVKTVGVLVTVIGVTLLLPSIRKEKPGGDIFFVGIASCFGFICIDIYYVWIDRIWAIYLLDALVHAVLLLLWVFALFKKSQNPF